VDDDDDDNDDDDDDMTSDVVSTLINCLRTVRSTKHYWTHKL
jgi:hypothetical protein